MKNIRLQTLCTAIATLVLRSCSPAPAYASAPLTLRYTSKAESTQPYMIEVWQGETVDLQCTLTAYGSAVTLATNASAYLWYQTNGMESAWWRGPATATTNGIITAHWTPALDVGASSYTYFIGVGDSATNTLYRSYGIIRMGRSPGYVPNTLAIPPATIDFDTVTVANAPWATPDDVSTAIGEIVEADPEALPVATAAYSIASAAVPKTRTINGKALSSNIVLDSDDIGAVPLDGDGVATASAFEAVDDMGVYGGIWKSFLTATALTIGDGATGDFYPLKFDDDGISSDLFNVSWPENNDGSPLATLADIDDEIADFITAADLTPYATTNWVESIRGIHADIASNVVYHVVVSNGHWLIQEVQ